MQVKGAKDELLTDEVEGPLTQQKKTEGEETGGISSHPLLHCHLPLCAFLYSSLLPRAWQVSDLLHQMATMLLPPGEPSRRVTVRSIRMSQLRPRRSRSRLWTNQTHHAQLHLGMSRHPPQELPSPPAGTAPPLSDSRTSASSARPARPCEASSNSLCFETLPSSGY